MSQTNRATTMAALLKQLAKRAENQTPEQRAKMKAALLRFAAGRSKPEREWVN